MDDFDKFYLKHEGPKVKGFIFRWLVNALALAVTAWIVKGIEIHGVLSLFFAAMVVGVLNAFVRPIVLILTLPLNILTMGLFTFVINGFMIMIAAKVVRGFFVADFWSALVGAIFLAIISFLINLFVADDGSIEVIPPRWH
ncbi:MAG: phage holin family protein [Deltaproteobacteria bacterium]|nr:MAG: phage holin family protein [Deltaproteobacteria bacterium]